MFDIGIAGPIAGFLVAVPALFIGVAMSNVVKLPADFVGLELGEPLLFKFASWAFWGPVRDGYVPTGMGSVTEVDGRSGAILRTIPVGVDPVALAILRSIPYFANSP